MNKAEYKRHMNLICKSLPCLSDAHGNEEFIEDLIMLKNSVKKLFKAVEYMYLYPHPPEDRKNEMLNDIDKQKDIIADICTERDIGYTFYSAKDYEYKTFKQAVKLMRRGNVLNTYIGL